MIGHDAPAARLSSRWLRGLVAAMVVGSVVVSAQLMKGMWFHADAWLYLTRPLTPSNLLESHAGHWASINLLVTKVLLAVGGLDYWPVWLIPRLLAWPAVCLTIWWVTIRRGGALVTTTSMLGVLLVFGSTGWVQSWIIGNQVGHVMAALLGHLVFAVREPTLRHQVGAAAALILALMSGGIGVALLLGLTTVVVVTRKGRRWWPSALAGLVVYGAWYLSFGGRGGSASLSAVVDIPKVAFVMTQSAVERFLRVPTALAGLVVVALVGWLLWLLITRRLTAGDGVHLFTAAIFIALATLVRVDAGSAQTTAVRYTYTVTLLALPVLVSRLPAPRRLATGVGVVLVAALCAWGNVGELQRRVEFLEGYSQRSREVVVTAAALLIEGEPAVEGNSVDFPRAGRLSVERVRTLVERGWRPTLVDDEDVIASARGDLRISSRPTQREGTNCRQLSIGAHPIVTDRPIVVHPTRGSRVVAAAEDDGGRMVQEVPTNRGAQWISIHRSGEVRAQLVVKRDPVEVCDAGLPGT